MDNKKLINFRGEMTAEEMARIAGVTAVSWREWERGVRMPSVRLIMKISERLGIDPVDFFKLFTYEKSN